MISDGTKWLDSAVLVHGLANLLQKLVEIVPFEQSVAISRIAMHWDFGALSISGACSAKRQGSLRLRLFGRSRLVWPWVRPRLLNAKSGHHSLTKSARPRYGGEKQALPTDALEQIVAWWPSLSGITHNILYSIACAEAETAITNATGNRCDE